MKFYGFKIFKFSTILKKAEHIKDSLLSIYKVIKKLCIYTADFIINIFYIISKNFKNINRESSYKKLYKYLIKDTQKKSILVFMGAGSITKIAYKFVNKNNE